MIYWTDCTQCGPHELALQGGIERACFCACHHVHDDEGDNTDG